MLLRKYIWLIVLVAAFAFGCGEDGDDPTGTNGGNAGKPLPGMVADWTYQTVTVNGSSASLATVLDFVPNAVGAELWIRADGAFVYEEVNSQGGQLYYESGFIFIDGSEVDVNVQMDSDGSANRMSRLAWTLSGDTNTMTLTENDQGDVIIFTLIKQP